VDELTITPGGDGVLLQRRTLAADALIASTYLAGTNTRRCAVRSPPFLAVLWARTR
jgi:hypothetical protein